jgi:hypothetical protein
MLLDQADLTLNMMGALCVNLPISAAMHMYGQFDFNWTPLVPPGTIVAAQEKLKQ